MPATKLTAGALIADAVGLWRSSSCIARAAALALVLAAGSPVTAQEPDAASQTNDAVAAEVIARINDMVQAAEPGQPEDEAPPEGLAPTNAPPQAGGTAQALGDSRRDRSNRFENPSRPQSSDRRSRSWRSSRSRSDQSNRSGSASDFRRGSYSAPDTAAPGTNAVSAGLDYSAFRLIVDRNIFDPNRFPHAPGRSGPRLPPKSFDSLTLVGTMNYEKGSFAFFDGTSSDYRKALKLSDVIAGYKVTNIAPDSVTLLAGTNTLQLKVGNQLRREEDGPWMVSGQAGSYAAAPSSASTSTNSVAASATPSSDAASSGAESDIIKKLMQRRAQE
jgi:hypothetical protein